MIVFPISWMLPTIGWSCFILGEAALLSIAYMTFKDARRYHDGFLTFLGVFFVATAIFLLLLALTMIGIVGWS